MGGVAPALPDLIRARVAEQRGRARHMPGLDLRRPSERRELAEGQGLICARRAGGAASRMWRSSGRCLRPRLQLFFSDRCRINQSCLSLQPHRPSSSSPPYLLLLSRRYQRNRPRRLLPRYSPSSASIVAAGQPLGLSLRRARPPSSSVELGSRKGGKAQQIRLRTVCETTQQGRHLGTAMVPLTADLPPSPEQFLSSRHSSCHPPCELLLIRFSLI